MLINKSADALLLKTGIQTLLVLVIILISYIWSANVSAATLSVSEEEGMLKLAFSSCFVDWQNKAAIGKLPPPSSCGAVGNIASAYCSPFFKGLKCDEVVDLIDKCTEKNLAPKCHTFTGCSYGQCTHKGTITNHVYYYMDCSGIPTQYWDAWKYANGDWRTTTDYSCEKTPFLSKFAENRIICPLATATPTASPTQSPTPTSTQPKCILVDSASGPLSMPRKILMTSVYTATDIPGHCCDNLELGTTPIGRLFHDDTHWTYAEYDGGGLWKAKMPCSKQSGADKDYVFAMKWDSSRSAWAAVEQGWKVFPDDAAIQGGFSIGPDPSLVAYPFCQNPPKETLDWMNAEYNLQGKPYSGKIEFMIDYEVLPFDLCVE